MKNYHTIHNYYRLYSHLCREVKIEPKRADLFSGIGLLHHINQLLKQLNCIEMTPDELNIKLTNG